jgi:pimeloyl-ACP methyl ester carboxylesterase
MTSTADPTDGARRALLAGAPVQERRLRPAGIPTAVLEGGDGPPMVLLHGPGEFAASWLPVLPDLVRTHRVLVPDLPGHGASGIPDGPLDAERVLSWLGELIEHTCPSRPVLVGRVVGGAVGARFAADHPGALDALVLVDSLGLTGFAPDPRFALAMHRFLGRPDADSYHRFMEFCAFDLDRVREHLGGRWAPFAAYAVERAGDPGVQAATGALIGHFGAVAMPSEVLDRIDVPTTLIWGRHDLATPLRVAEQAAARHGWPLHVIDDAGDDPVLDRPDEFLHALRAAIALPVPGATS